MTHAFKSLVVGLALLAQPAFRAISPGGPVSPDGKTELTCDLPEPLRKRNTGGRDGAGLCVFTSIMHSARYQNEERLWDFQAKMKSEPGGGYPDKVDKMVTKYGSGTVYVQHTGGNPSFLDLAIKTGRMPSVTYDGRDGVFYKGRIAHMVNLVHIDADQAAILDNNYPTKILWTSRAEFIDRWKGNSGGWAVVLLAPPPAPVPHN